MKKMMVLLTSIVIGTSTLTGCSTLKERIGENKKDLTAAKKQKEENEKKQAEEQQKQEQLEKEQKEKLGILGNGSSRVGSDDYGYINVPTDYKNVESSQLGSDGLHYVSEDKSHAIGLFKMNINKATQATADTDVEPEIAGLNYAKVYEEEGAEVAAGKVDSDIFVNVRYIEGKYADGKVKTVFLFNEKDGNNATVHIISLQGTKDDIEKMFPVVGSWKKTKE